MFYYYGFGPEFWLMILAAIIVAVAQAKISGSYAKYSRVATRRGMTGAQVARAILDQNGLQDIPVQISNGQLSDHYDPRSRVIRLSPKVYNDASIASVAVAAHEVGHAIQHKVKYPAIGFRDALLPIVNISSSLGWFALAIGLFLQNGVLLQIGIISLIVIALFQFATLPLEFNASKRAIRLLETNTFIYEDEVPMAKSMLNAAAFTYVAALISSLLNILRMIAIANRNQRR